MSGSQLFWSTSILICSASYEVHAQTVSTNEDGDVSTDNEIPTLWILFACLITGNSSLLLSLYLFFQF